MKRIAILSVIAITGCASAPQKPADEGQSIPLTAAQARKCAAGGGCIVIPKDTLEEAVSNVANQAGQSGYEAGLSECKRGGT